MNLIRRLPVEAGLDAERALLERVHAGATDCALLLWRPQDAALVMPRRLERLDGFARAAASCAELGWPVALRDTGGEPVPQSSAVLNVALAYAVPATDDEHRRIETAYRRLCDPLCEWLLELGQVPDLGAVDGAFCDGRFNVTLGQRKLVGTAQRWRKRGSDGRHVALAHGAILMENLREEMVAVVNAFYRDCALDTRCRATSHVALDECVEDAWAAAEGLGGCYRRSLALAGLPEPE
ncbi:MAG: lipoate--protein ligase family protein [Pseudomonas sp.]|nr:lipoate--protein ligase family protein [Pseudomonas sp.]